MNMADFGGARGAPKAACLSSLRLVNLRNKMSIFPELLSNLPKFEGPFDAYKLQAAGGDRLFAAAKSSCSTSLSRRLIRHLPISWHLRASE